MSIMCILSFVVPSLPIDFDTPIGELIFNNILYFLLIIVFPFIQMLIRYYTTSKQAIKENIFFSVPLGGKNIYNRLVYYIITLFIFFIPLITMKSLAYINMKEVLSLVVWFIIIELMLRLSIKHTLVHFTKDGILVRGVDMSIDIPLGNDLYNHSGFYNYKLFDEYELEGNTLKLYLDGDRGNIICVIPDEIIEPVLAFLGAKHIGPINKNNRF